MSVTCEFCVGLVSVTFIIVFASSQSRLSLVSVAVNLLRFDLLFRQRTDGFSGYLYGDFASLIQAWIPVIGTRLYDLEASWQS